MNDRLYRTRDDRILGGVAGGVADYFAIDPSVVRIVWAILALFSGGALLLLYIVMWVVIPEEPADASSATRETGSTTGAATASDAGSAAGVAAADAAPTGSPAAMSSPLPASPDWRTQRSMERARRRAERRAGRVGGHDSSAGVIFGVVLVVLGGWFLLQEYIPELDAGRIWPVILIVIGVVVLLGAIRPGGRRG